MSQTTNILLCAGFGVCSIYAAASAAYEIARFSEVAPSRRGILKTALLLYASGVFTTLSVLDGIAAALSK